MECAAAAAAAAVALEPAPLEPAPLEPAPPHAGCRVRACEETQVVDGLVLPSEERPPRDGNVAATAALAGLVLWLAPDLAPLSAACGDGAGEPLRALLGGGEVARGGERGGERLPAG